MKQKLRRDLSSRLQEAKETLSDSRNFDLDSLQKLAEVIMHTIDSGGRIAFVGNGGSAAEAMHIAAEFSGKCVKDHRPLPVVCLNESQSAITAIANDYGVHEIFARQVAVQLREGDVLIALSTSGKSSNILECLRRARELRVECYLWTGDNITEEENVTSMRVFSNSTPRIQEVHLVWGHILAEVIETRYEK